MANWIVKRGEREVPVADNITLRKWAGEGRFKPSDLVFHPVLQRWFYAQDVLEIRDAFPAAHGVAAPLQQTTDHPPGSAHPSPHRERDFVIQQSGHEFRAPNVETLRRWAGEGRVLADSSVFHPGSNEWMPARDIPELASAYQQPTLAVKDLARNYRQLVLWVGVQILLSLFLMVSDALALLLLPGLLVTIVALVYYAYRTAIALGSTSAPLWAVAMLIPCINIITLLVLSSNATAVCRANGIPVGFLGPEVK